MEETQSSEEGERSKLQDAIKALIFLFKSNLVIHVESQVVLVFIQCDPYRRYLQYPGDVEGDGQEQGGQHIGGDEVGLSKSPGPVGVAMREAHSLDK